jgi:hypothetical protein
MSDLTIHDIIGALTAADRDLQAGKRRLGEVTELSVHELAVMRKSRNTLEHQLAEANELHLADETTINQLVALVKPLVDVIREIQSCAGEGQAVARICNAALAAHKLPQVETERST